MRKKSEVKGFHLVFHGTHSNFDKFFSADELNKLRQKNPNWDWREEKMAVHFSDDVNLARQYGDRIISAWIDIKNFKTYNFRGYNWIKDNGKKLNDVITKAKKDGYSGLVAVSLVDRGKDPKEPLIKSDHYIVWTPDTIRDVATGKNMYENIVEEKGQGLSSVTDGSSYSQTGPELGGRSSNMPVTITKARQELMKGVENVLAAHKEKMEAAKKPVKDKSKMSETNELISSAVAVLNLKGNLFEKVRKMKTEQVALPLAIPGVGAAVGGALAGMGATAAGALGAKKLSGILQKYAVPREIGKVHWDEKPPADVNAKPKEDDVAVDGFLAGGTAKMAAKMAARGVKWPREPLDHHINQEPDDRPSFHDLKPIETPKYYDPAKPAPYSSGTSHLSDGPPPWNPYANGESGKSMKSKSKSKKLKEMFGAAKDAGSQKRVRNPQPKQEQGIKGGKTVPTRDLTDSIVRFRRYIVNEDIFDTAFDWAKSKESTPEFIKRGIDSLQKYRKPEKDWLKPYKKPDSGIEQETTPETKSENKPKSTMDFTPKKYKDALKDTEDLVKGATSDTKSTETNPETDKTTTMRKSSYTPTNIKDQSRLEPSPAPLLAPGKTGTGKVGTTQTIPISTGTIGKDTKTNPVAPKTAEKQEPVVPSSLKQQDYVGIKPAYDTNSPERKTPDYQSKIPPTDPAVAKPCSALPLSFKTSATSLCPGVNRPEPEGGKKNGNKRK